MWLAEAEIPQRSSVGLGTGIVDLVGGQEHGLAAAPQNLDDRLVFVQGTDSGVDHQHHDISHRHRDLGLPGDRRRHTDGVPLVASGVEQRESTSSPLGFVGHSISGHSGYIFDHRFATTEDAVHQGGLAHVGPTDHRHDGQRLVGIVIANAVEIELLGDCSERLFVPFAFVDHIAVELDNVVIEVSHVTPALSLTRQSD